MQRVRVERTITADVEDVRELMGDVEAFMRAGGFDEARVDGDTLVLRNRVGLFDIELVLDVLSDAEAELAYEQREGIFESMATTYDAEELDDGRTLVTAETTHRALDLPVVGELIDATVIERQRRSEIESQFDWLEAQTTT